MIDIREMSVLIADDMENMYNSIRSIMRLLKFGRKFTYVNNGQDALAKLKEGSYDLAMLDNNMPGITGLELLGIIRSDRALRDMPVIMITGHAEKEFITNAAETDIDAYILKPITVNLLKQKIPEVIEKANSPSPMAVHLKKADAAAEKGDLDEAVAEARRAMQENPNSTRPLRTLAGFLIQKGELQEAEKSLLKAVAMNPIDVIALNHLGDLYLKRDDIDNALKYFSKAVKISPRHYERGLALGKILIRKKMVDKALPIFNKVFELARDPLHVKEDIAAFCIEEGATDYAARLLRGIVEQSRERGDLLYKLALLCKEEEEKLYYFHEADRLQPGSVDIKLQLAKIYLSQGMILRAEKPLKEILHKEPEHKEARQLLRQCI